MTTTRHHPAYDAAPWPKLPMGLDMSAGRAVELMTQCEAALSTHDEKAEPAHRAAILSILAIAQSLAAPQIAPVTLRTAESVAAEVGSAPARAYVLIARYATDLSPGSLPARRRLVDQLMTLLASDDCSAIRRATLPMAYFIYVGTLLEAGDTRAVDHALSPEYHVNDMLTPLLDNPFADWFRCARATMDGRLVAAERLADTARDRAVAEGDLDAVAVHTGQIAVIRWMQGRISEMEPVFQHLRHGDPTEPIWAVAVAWIWCRQGRIQAAGGLLESLPPITAWPRGRNFLAAAALLAEVAAAIGPDLLVDQVRRELSPFSDRVVTIGLGITCWGTVARPLALLAARQGRYDAAARHYRTAIGLSSRIGAQPWLIESQIELAALLADHGRRLRTQPSDPLTTAQELVMEATRASEHLGLAMLRERAVGLLARITCDVDTGRAADAPAVTATGSRDATRVTVLGEFSVTVDGVVMTWKSRRAETLLKILIARRGAAVSRDQAIDLLWPGADPDLLRNRLAVAVSTIRRTIDPHRRQDPDYFVTATREVLRLRLDRLRIDSEDLLMLAAAMRGRPARHQSDDAARRALLRDIVDRYTGEAFADDLDSPWAQSLRQQAHLAFFAAAHELADRVARCGGYHESAELYRHILRMDPYDKRAHDGLVATLAAIGATSQLAAAREDRALAAAHPGHEPAVGPVTKSVMMRKESISRPVLPVREIDSSAAR